MRGDDMRQEFVRQVRRYLADDMTMSDLEAWTAPYFTSLAELGEADPVGRLWGTLQACLYEIGEGHVEEAWCRAELQAAVPVLEHRGSASGPA
jgi:hypothetical protein